MCGDAPRRFLRGGSPVQVSGSLACKCRIRVEEVEPAVCLPMFQILVSWATNWRVRTKRWRIAPSIPAIRGVPVLADAGGYAVRCGAYAWPCRRCGQATYTHAVGRLPLGAVSPAVPLPAWLIGPDQRVYDVHLRIVLL